MPAGYNYAAAFIEFVKGTTIEDIAMALAIPLHTLKTKAREEGWKRLAAEVPMALTAPGIRAERDMAKIEANRAKNLEIVHKLQEDLTHQVELLLKGELRVERVTPKGEIVQLPPSIKDRHALAAYAKTIHEMSYRALGDVIASREEGSGMPGGAAQQITIVLPLPISEPRQHRTYDVDASVVTPPSLLLDVETLPREGSGTDDLTDATPTPCEDITPSVTTPITTATP